MAQRKPVVIDGDIQRVSVESMLNDVVSSEVGSVLTSGGVLIPRAEFKQVAVPDGFETNLSHINKGAGKEG